MDGYQRFRRIFKEPSLAVKDGGKKHLRGVGND